jgi:hypothetical protein
MSRLMHRSRPAAFAIRQRNEGERLPIEGQIDPAAIAGRRHRDAALVPHIFWSPVAVCRWYPTTHGRVLSRLYLRKWPNPRATGAPGVLSVPVG